MRFFEIALENSDHYMFVTCDSDNDADELLKEAEKKGIEVKELDGPPKEILAS